MPDQNKNCATCKYYYGMFMEYPTCSSWCSGYSHWEPKENAKTNHVEKIADNHWKWVEGLLSASNAGLDDLHVYLYKTAFIHGFKHGKED